MTESPTSGCLRTDIEAAGAGSAAQVLTALAGLPSLTFIDFSSQRLYGPLPANISFPNLKFMNLEYNMLQVCTRAFQARAWSGAALLHEAHRGHQAKHSRGADCCRDQDSACRCSRRP